MNAKILRQLKQKARARAITAWLLDSLGATTTYPTREPQRREKIPWRPLYGSDPTLVPGSKLLDSDGKPTRMAVSRKWTHEPGEILTSSAFAKDDNDVRWPVRYMVRPDHSLRRI